MSEAPRFSPVTLEEFRDMHFGDRKAELIDGMIVIAHAFPTSRHGDIAASASAALTVMLRDKKHPCRAQVGSGVTIRLIHDYELGPDVLAHCGGDKHKQGEPVLIIEVLSPSNRPAELTRKLAAYRTLPGLRHILLVSQDDYSVEHWRRVGDGHWSGDLLEGPGAVLTLADFGAQWRLDEFYGDA